MTAWTPIVKTGKFPASEFSPLQAVPDNSRFQSLTDSMKPAARRSPDASRTFDPAFVCSITDQREAASVLPNVQPARDAQLKGEIEALTAEIERLKMEHVEQLKITSQATAVELAVSVSRQHEAAIADLTESLVRATADVLRPMLTTFAFETAVRDFEKIVGETLRDPKCTGFSIQAPENFLEQFREALPTSVDVLCSSSDHPEFRAQFRDALISSRLEEWGKSIAGHLSRG